MSGLTRPRGPQPTRVYWTRRLLVLFTAFVLVFALGRALTRSSDGSSASDVARQVAEQTARGPSSGSTDPVDSHSKAPIAKKTKKPAKKKTKQPLPEPNGECVASDVVVTPVVKRAVAGRDIRIRLQLHTRFAVACTWVVSPRTLTLKITSGKDDIWSSRECSRPIGRQEVVLRAAKTRTVSVVWDGRRSNPGCAAPRYWALPGYYHVAASALGGEPADLQFRLTQPQPRVITPSPDPKPGKKRTQRATASPSGAVEPNG